MRTRESRTASDGFWTRRKSALADETWSARAPTDVFWRSPRASVWREGSQRRRRAGRGEGSDEEAERAKRTVDLVLQRAVLAPEPPAPLNLPLLPARALLRAHVLVVHVFVVVVRLVAHLGRTDRTLRGRDLVLLLVLLLLVLNCALGLARAPLALVPRRVRGGECRGRHAVLLVGGGRARAAGCCRHALVGGRRSVELRGGSWWGR